MPELPEVETIRRDLDARLRGQRVATAWTSGRALRLGRPVNWAALEKAVVGTTIEGVSRRAKYLVAHLSSGQALLVHLGMSGRFELTGTAAPMRPHTHCILRFERGQEELRFVDPRRFGSVRIVALRELACAPELQGLGPDPLEPDFTPAVLAAALGRVTRASIKVFLMDQRRVAGLGNIYACEALFAARISPRRRAAGLGRARTDRLHRAIVSVLSQAVARRGTTFRDYVDSWGMAGENQYALQVFMRQGEPCLVCGQAIRRIVQSARSTFFCPRCQM